jgi:arylsulfatase A-like enzyme
VDGVSVKAVLEGEGAPGERPPLYWEFHERGFEQAVRMGKWKAVRHGLHRPVELYDLDADLSEATDVAGMNPEIVARVEEYLKGARTESTLWPLEEAGASAE